MPESKELLEQAGEKLRRIYQLKEEMYTLLRWLEENTQHPPDPHLNSALLEYRTIYPVR